jgi:hypothetical protein
MAPACTIGASTTAHTRTGPGKRRHRYRRVRHIQHVTLHDHPMPGAEADAAPRASSSKPRPTPASRASHAFPHPWNTTPTRRTGRQLPGGARPTTPTIAAATAGAHPLRMARWAAASRFSRVSPAVESRMLAAVNRTVSRGLAALCVDHRRGRVRLAAQMRSRTVTWSTYEATSAPAKGAASQDDPVTHVAGASCPLRRPVWAGTRATEP